MRNIIQISTPPCPQNYSSEEWGILWSRLNEEITFFSKDLETPTYYLYEGGERELRILQCGRPKPKASPTVPAIFSFIHVFIDGESPNEISGMCLGLDTDDQKRYTMPNALFGDGDLHLFAEAPKVLYRTIDGVEAVVQLTPLNTSFKISADR